MICWHYRVPNACSTLTSNRNYLHNTFFALELRGICARRFNGTPRARIGPARVRGIAAK